jgi:4-amino-4-deoxy-L-arabinose transferase-like glycosyltransferase
MKVKPPAAMIPPPAKPNPFVRLFDAADVWLDLHMEWIVWIVVLIGLGLRVSRAAALYLNGDEAMIMFAPLQRSLAGVYRAMLAHPHGPLPNFLLHYMSFLGSSELYFRLPSVIAGALVSYVGYRWAAETFGKGAGFVTACILAFSPAMVILSAQLRFYAVHMLFMAGSVYCLERALREKSTHWMRLFGAALVLALLSEYMSIWYTIAIGGYALIGLMVMKAPRRLLAEWLATQGAAAAVLITAYFTHLQKLRGSAGDLFAQNGWLRSSYYHAESQTVVDFLRASTEYLFGYLFANVTLGTWMLYAFLAGLGVVLWGRSGRQPAQRLAVISLLLPPMVTAAAAIIKAYPYGGSRHDAFLALFLAAPIAAAISFMARQRTLMLVLLVACLTPLWLESAQQHYLDDHVDVSKREQMTAALDYLSTRTPRPRVVVVDQLGSSTLGYYLCHGQVDDWRSVGSNLTSYRCAGVRVLTIEAWGVPNASIPVEFARARQNAVDLFPDPVWAFSVSFTQITDRRLVTDDAGAFGKIEIFRVSP